MTRTGERKARTFLAFIAAVAAAQPLLARPVAAATQEDAAGQQEAAAGEEDTGQPAADLEARLKELEALVESLKAEIALLRAGGTGYDRNAELEKRIEALSGEIERLRLGEAAAPEAGEPVAGFGPAASKVYRVKRGTSISGYGEMPYQNFDREKDDGNASGKIDQADFLRAVMYFGYKFNDRFLFNSEVEFEHATTGEGKTGEVSLEFAYVDFKAIRAFGVRGGLLLIPMGLINELHEPTIFHGAQRPEVERFIIPSTWRDNGLGIYGEAGPISYRAYLVAGLRSTKATNRVSGFSPDQGIRGGRQSGGRSDAEDLAVTARVDYTAVPGVVVGASAYSGETAQGACSSLSPSCSVVLRDARLSLWDIHADASLRGLRLRGVYARGILSEAFEISVLQDADPLDSVVPAIAERIEGWYGEVAYNLLAPHDGTEQELFAFVRYEEADTQRRVAVGTVANPAFDRQVRTLGFTYRPIPSIVVKLDYQDFRNRAGTGIDQVNFALGYLF
ncbi:MAG: hypothetical protein HY510_04365 [Acidobacteria bacterium]|nr:hypothetical protein [Acidobacteriota bacterium]